MKIRIGTGYDIHKLVPGRQLILGGVAIKYDLGLAGHSDADVVLHALSDAIFGALSLPDIGMFFPDNQQESKDIDSKKILLFANKKLLEHGFQIANIDIVIIAESPKLNKYYYQIRNSLANILEIDTVQIGLKAKTNEGMGAIGNNRAIAAIVNVLIQKE